jgi:glycogen synthase
LKFPATLDGNSFDFEVFKHRFDDRVTAIYFWDELQLHWTNATAVYPADPLLGLRLFSSVTQAMAGYIKSRCFDTVHGHDHHVALLPFYLGDEYLSGVAYHFTIHNATYQGICPDEGSGFELLDSINLPGSFLFHEYFDFFGNVNPLKGCIIKTHKNFGKITTVSGDFSGTWGYAGELRESASQILERAQVLKPGRPVREVFVPNRHLDIFEKLPIVGITNGLSEWNHPKRLPELEAVRLQQELDKLGKRASIFRNPAVTVQMLAEDHHFDCSRLEVKSELKRLLHLEAFGTAPPEHLVFLTAVGRLVSQKNLSLVADIAAEVFAMDSGVKFVVLASAPEGDGEGQATEAHFAQLARDFPERFCYRSGFSLPVSKLILAGGDFCLIPSRFEPCGLVDYEASLLGTLVIGRRTGGLTKVSDCAYLYDWLDIGDREGERTAFLEQIRCALETYRNDPGTHDVLVQRAMSIDTGWQRSAAQYLMLYRYGVLVKQWQKKRSQRRIDVLRFAKKLIKEEPAFPLLFSATWHSSRDRELESALKELWKGKKQV